MPDPRSPDPWQDVKARWNYLGQRFYWADKVDVALAAERQHYAEDCEIRDSVLLGVEQAILGIDRAGDDPDGALPMALIARQAATDLHLRAERAEADLVTARQEHDSLLDDWRAHDQALQDIYGALAVDAIITGPADVARLAIAELNDARQQLAACTAQRETTR